MAEKNTVAGYIEGAVFSSKDIDGPTLRRITGEISRVFSEGGKVLICGNGGSAADASHFAGELVGRFRAERRGLPAVALASDPAVITALGNDYGFHRIFERQVEALGRPGDILIALSTSGTSENVVRAAIKAREMGLLVLAFTSAACGSVPWADMHWSSSAMETSHTQERMLVAIHAVCFGVEAALED